METMKIVVLGVFIFLCEVGFYIPHIRAHAKRFGRIYKCPIVLFIFREFVVSTILFEVPLNN